VNAGVVRWVRYADGSGSTAFGTIDETTSTIAVHSGDMFAGSRPNGDTVALNDVAVLAPCQPTKIVALWNNLRSAAEKHGWAAPLEPLYFLKAPSSVVGHGAGVRRPISYSGRVLYEGELGVVIGTNCSNVAMDDVDQVVFGYTCVNDITAIDLINEDISFAQWSRAKGFDTFSPIGPYITQGLDPDSLLIQTIVGGRIRQDYPVTDMFFSPRQLVSLISRDMSLSPGDIVACGTSFGAMPMRPRVAIEVSIDGIGVLRNALAD
jgi:2-keto-4-pentenoate hydratase/2-oxohepta-3-ene-1,7-dioic acid hydratase in catechol pathway